MKARSEEIYGKSTQGT